MCLLLKIKAKVIIKINFFSALLSQPENFKVPTWLSRKFQFIAEGNFSRETGNFHCASEYSDSISCFSFLSSSCSYFMNKIKGFFLLLTTSLRFFLTKTCNKKKQKKKVKVFSVGRHEKQFYKRKKSLKKYIIKKKSLQRHKHKQKV